jgi:hypothetical protein
VSNPIGHHGRSITRINHPEGGILVADIMKLQSENGEKYLPPIFYLKFTQEEFPAFLANPTAAVKQLGQPVKNLTVTVKDHVWDSRKEEWITDQSDTRFSADGSLPQSSSWGWLCGYQDEQCVCERVVM